jgi:hypothetical protein
LQREPKYLLGMGYVSFRYCLPSQFLLKHSATPRSFLPLTHHFFFFFFL